MGRGIKSKIDSAEELLSLTEQQHETLCACPKEVLGREFVQGNAKHVIFKIEGNYAYARIASIVINGSRYDVPESEVDWFKKGKKSKKCQHVYQYIYQTIDDKLVYLHALSPYKPTYAQINYVNHPREYPKWAYDVTDSLYPRLKNINVTCSI